MALLFTQDRPLTTQTFVCGHYLHTLSCRFHLMGLADVFVLTLALLHGADQLIIILAFILMLMYEEKHRTKSIELYKCKINVYYLQIFQSIIFVSS